MKNEYESFGPLFRRYLGNATVFTIPENITAIGDYAFRHCKTLKRINVPEHVQRIGIYAFQWCSSLEEIILPRRVEHFGDGAFMGCSRLKAVHFPEGLESMYIPLLKDCLKLQEITVPSSVRKIVQNAFTDCHALRKLSAEMGQLKDVPESIRELAALTFLEEYREESSANNNHPFSKGQQTDQGERMREIPPGKAMKDYVESHVERLVFLAVQTDRPLALHTLLAGELADVSQTDALLEMTAGNGQTDMTAMLLDYRNRMSGDRISDLIEDEFSLE